ncbi:hypothetical protein GcM3_124024 [Golovinomyces cichoracearum]|uniref:Uncharacterized protein n=1 Tax=Golovinomyces cichoracearum TaxID=62708 RepID=A0A420I6H5_9PEZI|nr:hypothetical protein GcM3_124024 [Golovinomyces cichoracearum]
MLLNDGGQCAVIFKISRTAQTNTAWPVGHGRHNEAVRMRQHRKIRRGSRIFNNLLRWAITETKTDAAALVANTVKEYPP